MENYFPE